MSEQNARQDYIDYCMTKKSATGDFPFDETTLVLRVGGKMFALCDTVNEKPTMNLKCAPELSRDLRATYPAIRPGYHMNKEHWNTIDLDGDLPKGLIRSLIDHSYELVADGLSRTERERAGLPPKDPKSKNLNRT